MNFQLIWLTLLEILKAFGIKIPEVNIPKRIGNRVQEPQAPYIHVTPMMKPRLPIKIDITGSRPWEGIVWHHSQTNDSVQLDDYAGIMKYQMSYRIDYNPVSKEEFDIRKAAGRGTKFEPPFKTIAYNGVAEYAGGKLMFHWGRPLSMVGSHSGTKVSNFYNTNYIGLCMIGNYDVRIPTDEIWKFCLMLTRSFMDVFNIPAEKVIGHKEVYGKLAIGVEKLCPGKLWDASKFRGDL